MKGVISIVGMFALASAIPHVRHYNERAAKYEARMVEVYSEENLGQNTLEPVYLWNVKKELWEVPQCYTDMECEEKYTVDPYVCVINCIETNLRLMFERSADVDSEF